ncbi:PPM family protein phosphatase [Methylacidimicrobium cyclopophantes]|uniref:PPM family protein phosphatase n=1 Tax=Methylacidimicrobium cyclopophantes TaxID=1041766 RepID=A0A5E6MCN1_9BACT|nr:PP2C family serine/threonine-protein phosphatase [Methylacidimicrobium cyclopophantes]VVM07198.1 PPM family protein phosphatase [Methylacidimicrobium cyclopophantes]
MNFDSALLTNRGGRPNNEDACRWAAHGETIAWVVADGLGGERGGEVASRLAVDAFLEAFRLHPSLSPESLSSYVVEADRAIKIRQAEEPELSRMGSTIAAAVSQGHRLRAITLGDSRFYWFRNRKVFFQSKDHSLPQALCDAGMIAPDEIRSHPNRNVLLRCLGGPGAPEPEISPEGELEPGDALLLCTDGFWDPLPEADMEKELGKAASASDWLRRMEALRQERAPTLADDDNYTAIGVLVGSEPE